MTLTIELTPEQEAQLAAIAKQNGLDVNEQAKQLLAERLTETAKAYSVDKNHFYCTATPEEFRRALEEIAEMNRGLPVLPPEAFDRENLYEENFITIVASTGGKEYGATTLL